MANDNTITVLGNLTRDPEVSFTAGGMAYARLGIANNRRFKKKGSDEWTDEPNFFNITAWGDLAEHIGDSLGKGDRVIVFGRLEWRKWTADDGEEKTAVQIVADEVAPSLRWATAEVTKTEKPSGGGNSAGRDDLAPIDEEPF